MSHRFFVSVGALVLLVPLAVFAQTAKSWTPPKTPDGQPDLQGIWTTATLTPLERPAELAGKEFFTEKEAAEYEKRLLDQGNRDRRPGTASADVAGAYNEFWFERGSKVVETTNFTDKTAFRGSGPNFHLIERFTRTSPDTIVYEFTANDESSFTRPWTAQIPMKKTPDPIFEYACHEGNYGMEGILRGARAEEKTK